MAFGDPARRVVDILTGAWQAQALYAAAALGVPDHIAAGCSTSAELAKAAESDPDSIERLARLLAGMKVLAVTEDGRYQLTEVGDLLRSDHGESMRDMAVIYGEEFHRAWGQVVPAVRTGVSGFEHAFGRTLPDFLRNEPGAGAKFQRSMQAGNAFFRDVARSFDLAGCRTVVDVAGGSGQLLSTVLQAHPALHGTLFDLPHMTPLAEEHLGREVERGRWDAVGGDLFQAVPAGADVYLLSRVLQDWDDARCVRLLTNLRTAMPETGRLLIIERVVPTDGSALLALLWDLHLLMAAGGRERSLDGYRTLLSDAGLRLVSTTPLALETTLLVAAKA